MDIHVLCDDQYRTTIAIDGNSVVQDVLDVLVGIRHAEAKSLTVGVPKESAGFKYLAARLLISAHLPDDRTIFVFGFATKQSAQQALVGLSGRFAELSQQLQAILGASSSGAHEPALDAFNGIMDISNRINAFSDELRRKFHDLLALPLSPENTAKLTQARGQIPPFTSYSARSPAC